MYLCHTLYSDPVYGWLVLRVNHGGMIEVCVMFNIVAKAKELKDVWFVVCGKCLWYVIGLAGVQMYDGD